VTVLGLGDASASEAGTISSCTFVKVYRVEVVNVFFGALCSYNTSQDVVDSAATSDMHGKELWFAKKICSPSQGCTISWGCNTTDTTVLHFILLYKSNEFDVSWGAGHGSAWVRSCTGVTSHICCTFIGEFIGFGFDPKAL
jgi:hypothetical protein